MWLLDKIWLAFNIISTAQHGTESLQKKKHEKHANELTDNLIQELNDKCFPQSSR